ncbi:MAG TPA: pantetheine-phosphate adenylyltransferase [Mycobacteriales bacterium]
MTRALCPGSFDPPTLGHLDIIGCAANLFEQVTVAVVVNPAKSGLFPVAERVSLLRRALTRWTNITVDSFDGLLVDYAAHIGASAIVKGIRDAADAGYEMQMAQMNAHLAGVRTVFVPTDPAHAFVSSSLVKQVDRYGGDVSDLVPECVAEALAQRHGHRE